MNSLRNIIVIVAALLASPSLLHAQGVTEAMSAKIPFPFTVQGIAMPAGTYDMSYISRDRLWRIRTFGHYDLEVSTRTHELPEPSPVSNLIFEHNADGYTLRQIQQAGQRDALDVQPLSGNSSGKESNLQEASSRTVPNQTVAQSVAHTKVTAQ